MPSPWTGGRQMLVIQKKDETDFLFKSNQSKLVVKVKAKQAIYCQCLVGNLTRGSIAGILRSGKGERQYGVFELHVGYFPGRRRSDLNGFPCILIIAFRPVPDNLEPFWRIEFSIMALHNGRQEIREAFSLKDRMSYFDGFHSYLLYPEP